MYAELRVLVNPVGLNFEKNVVWIELRDCCFEGTIILEMALFARGSVVLLIEPWNWKCPFYPD